MKRLKMKLIIILSDKMVKYMIVFRCKECNVIEHAEYDMDKLLANDSKELEHGQEITMKQISLGQKHANHVGFNCVMRYKDFAEAKEELKVFVDSM